MPMSESEAGERGERLQKVLSRAGIASRRLGEEMIADGRVAVNGKIAVLGTRANVETDRIEVDGVPIGVRSGLVYFLLNKPTGVVTTASDPQGRPTVVELVDVPERVYPVGRLDMETEGLLLLTNDGELTHRLTHPSFGVEKEYIAQVEGEPSRKALRTLREGVTLDDGITAPAKVGIVSPGVVRLTIHEGRNRQVRRMCDAVGYPVQRLVRTRIGSLRDAKLPPGSWRPLTLEEVRGLERSVGTLADDGGPVQSDENGNPAVPSA